jgi:signal transduction histidine kinase
MASRSPLEGLLRVPLVAKLVGANVTIVAVCAGLSAAGVWYPFDATKLILLGMAITVSATVTLGLVVLALRPLNLLEDTAQRVWAGDYAARVPESPLADQSMRRINTTFNLLLDRLTSDRQRMRELAATVIRSSDRERARAAAELHESAAQSIASISWQLGALARDAADTEWEPKLTSIKLLTEEVLEQVRFLAQTLHPRVLDDLGLAAALSQLARRAREGSVVNVVADVDPRASEGMDPGVAAALYHVAQEAVTNALYHANPRTITIRLVRSAVMTMLEVSDDGEGFDVPAQERRAGSGIFSMRERIGLVDAQLSIVSSIGSGTTVRAQLLNETVHMERSA